ncbi:SCO1/SenC [Ostertagia ostertagi]
MLNCRVLPRICSRLPLSSSLSIKGTSSFHFSTSKRNESKKPDADLEKELERLNEVLKKDLDAKVKESEAEIDKTFMNFKARAERDAYQRSSTMFSWRVAAMTLGIGASCLAALFWIRKIVIIFTVDHLYFLLPHISVMVELQRLEEREKHIKYLAGKARIGGDWELVNTEGKLEGSEQLKGNWLLLYFGFTHCPDICPDEIEKMVKVVDILDAKPDKEKIPIKPIFISVDPERDTVERVKEYCAEFSPKLKGFTGSVEQVNKVAKTFRVYHSQGPRTGKNKDDYIVDHTVITYLIDPDGLFHDYYGQTRTAEEIANIIEMKVLKYRVKNRKGILGF